MGRPLKIAKSASIDSSVGNAAGYGIVGGNTGLSTATILCRVKIGSNAEANGYIVRQKGKHKFLVSDGTNSGVCTLANTANGSLAANTMTVTAEKEDESTVRLYSLSNKVVRDFAGVQYLATFGSAAVAPAGTSMEIVSIASA